MNLHTVLFGQFTPPLVAKTTRHRLICKESKSGWTPPTPNQQVEYAEKMYDYIKRNPGAHCKDIASAIKKADSYMYRIRAILLDQKRIKEVKGAGRSTYLYVREPYAG